VRKVLAVVICAFVGLPWATASGRAAGPRITDGIVIPSADGTAVVATLMLPGEAGGDHPVPAVLETHGWGGHRERAATGILAELIERGYAVLTWDSRGFGESGGEANVGAPGFEVSDAKALLDYLSKRRDILQDGPGDRAWAG
jgi:ABC-2 type transport system ATP-binding protein